MDGTRFHDLRHFFASQLIGQGETAAYVRDQMGHSSIKVTFDTYGHLFPGRGKEASSKYEKASLDVVGVNECIGVSFKSFSSVECLLARPAVPALAIHPLVLHALEPYVAVIAAEVIGDGVLVSNESLQRSVLPNSAVDPSIVRVLRTLDPIAREADCACFVAGATRDLILVNIHGLRPGRATRDIDFGIAVENRIDSRC